MVVDQIVITCFFVYELVLIAQLQEWRSLALQTFITIEFIHISVPVLSAIYCTTTRRGLDLPTLQELQSYYYFFH
jgi:hypothetical protein